MSSLKIPNQFPWVVAAVVVAHGIIAIFLFGGTGEAIRKPRTATPEVTTIIAENEKPAPGTVAHPLGKTGTATPATDPGSSEAIPKKPETFGEADNAHFEPRFVKRFPRQSELNAAVAATDGPVTAEDIFKMAQADKLNVEAAPVPESVPASDTEAKAETDSDKKGSATFELPSAVAVAKAAPFSKIEVADATAAEDSIHRLRMVERSVPVAGPRAISTKKEEVHSEPVTETTPEPKLRFKTSLPSISKIKPIERTVDSPPSIKPQPTRVVAQPVVTPPVKAPPAQPSNQRKFRVFKPLPR